MATLTKDDLNHALTRALSAQDQRFDAKLKSQDQRLTTYVDRKFVVVDQKFETLEQKINRRADHNVAVLERKMERSEQTITKAVNDAFYYVPSREETNALTKRVERLEKKVG